MEVIIDQGRFVLRHFGAQKTVEYIQRYFRWLDSPLNYFYFDKVVGPELDQALEITGSTKSTQGWTFEGAITTLFYRFMIDETAQKAVENFKKVPFSRTKGVLGFWNDLSQAADRNVESSRRGINETMFHQWSPR